MFETSSQWHEGEGEETENEINFPFLLFFLVIIDDVNIEVRILIHPYLVFN